MLNKRFLFIVVFLSVCQFNFAAGQTQDYDLAEVKVLCESMQFEKAIFLGDALLNSTQNLKPGQIISLHQYMGFSFFNIGKQDSAKVHFWALLSLDPEYQLDPIQTSPKIISFFNSIKDESKYFLEPDKHLVHLKYVLVEDPRPSAAWRSALLPGWGQYYKKQEQKAKIFGIGFISGGLLTAGSYLFEYNYHQNYLDSEEQSQIDKYYDRYNQWQKTRKVFTYATAGIWFASFFDALWSDYNKSNLSLSYNANNTLRLSFNF